MDNHRVGSLNSLADYGRGESDIEDSDDEIDTEEGRLQSRSSFSVYTQSRVKTSARLVSYDDVAEEEDVEEISDKKREDKAEVIEEMLGDMKGEEKDRGSEESNEVDKTTEKSEAVIDDTVLARTDGNYPENEPTETKPEVIPSRIMPQLPPEPIGRCSNKLQEKIINLFEKKQRGNLDWNDNIQKRKDFRNPSIYEKLLSFCNLNETGSNYPKSLFDPTCWTEESYYENLSKAQKEAYEKKEKEKAKQARTQIEFVTGTKKPEEGKKRKSKWDVTAPAVKTATPPTKVVMAVPGNAASVGDIVPAAKKPKTSS